MTSHLRVTLAAWHLASGGVIAYPTEGVWGLGCNPDDKHAVLRLLELKQRPVEKGLILVAADIEQFAPYLQGLAPALRRRLTESWPGPVTWVVPDNGRAPLWVRGDHPGVALRVSDHPLVAALCRAFGGPVVSTSANPGGRQPARSALAVRRYFGKQLDFVLPGELGGLRGATTISDLVSGEVMRAG